MGLDHTLYLVKQYYGCEGDLPVVDGFPLKEQKMVVVDWRKNHWVHQWFCELNATANECEEVHVDTEELKTFADKLEAWVDDPEALPPVSEKFRGPFFGVHTDDPEYDKCRDFYRDDAKNEAEKVRKAIAWLEAVKNAPSRTTRTTTEYGHAIYQASW